MMRRCIAGCTVHPSAVFLCVVIITGTVTVSHSTEGMLFSLLLSSLFFQLVCPCLHACMHVFVHPTVRSPLSCSQLENELHTHLAANARRDRLPCADRSGDSPRADPTRSCWSIERFQARREDRDEDWEDPAEPIHGSFPITMNDLAPEPPDDATWYPDEPEWIWRDLSWAQRYLVDVYAVYGALVMGVGLLMKLTWNLVW